MLVEGVATFARNPNAVKESCLVVSTRGLFGVKIFRLGVIVLSKIKILLFLICLGVQIDAGIVRSSWLPVWSDDWRRFCDRCRITI